MESLRLIPYGEGAYSMLPASCTPQATNTANKQVILKLLSRALNPARAAPQTLSTREHNSRKPSKPNVLLLGKLLSNFKNGEVHEDHLQRVRISLLNFSGNSKVTLKQSDTLETDGAGETSIPRVPCKSQPPTSTY